MRKVIYFAGALMLAPAAAMAGGLYNPGGGGVGSGSYGIAAVHGGGNSAAIASSGGFGLGEGISAPGYEKAYSQTSQSTGGVSTGWSSYGAVSLDYGHASTSDW
jgi:hypothetical protein